jgi:hypothetical protein
VTLGGGWCGVLVIGSMGTGSPGMGSRGPRSASL